jgi:hypothetical protein
VTGLSALFEAVRDTPIRASKRPGGTVGALKRDRPDQTG